MEVKNSAHEYKSAQGALDKAKLKLSNVESAIQRKGKPANLKQQAELTDALQSVKHAESALTVAKQQLFHAGSALALPKGVTVAASSHPAMHLVQNKAPTRADAAATAALPNPLWARVRNFLGL